VTRAEDLRPPRPEVGLCSACRFAAVQRSAKGSEFWRCGRADFDPDYARYPRLPVERCPGFEPRAGEDRKGALAPRGGGG